MSICSATIQSLAHCLDGGISGAFGLLAPPIFTGKEEQGSTPLWLPLPRVSAAGREASPI